MVQFTLKEQTILVGMFLSKYDTEGLREMGFSGFVEAYNIIGFAMGVKPYSIRNYRDEFDTLYPNSRKGWHKRPMRENCKDVYDKFDQLNFTEFYLLIKGFLNPDTTYDPIENTNQSFAKRLATGIAAEQFFLSIYQTVPDFQGLIVENRTSDGCGYDFKLFSDSVSLGVEVKGLSGNNGSVLLTEKEYRVASIMKNNYYLFIAKNFAQQPNFTVYQNPIEQPLNFQMQQRQVTITNWSFTI